MQPARETPARGDLTAARTVLEDAIAAGAFPGAAWGVLYRGEFLALNALGSFTWDEDAPQVTPTTVYDLASVTKVVATAAAAMILCDRGLLDLDERVGDILPGFVVGMAPGSGKQRVTVRMLLAHSSGMLGYAPLYREASTPEALLREILRLPMQAQPGTRTEYSDFGFVLLGKALEVVTQEPLDAFCAREIFAPLAMDATRFRPAPDQRFAIPPTEQDTTLRHRVIQGEVQDEHAFILGGVAGHAGVFSNVPDLLRFAQCILAEGRNAEERALFRRETVELFATRQNPEDEKARGLGWDMRSTPSSSGRCFGPRSIGHLGYAGTSLWIDPDRQLAVALLTNRTWPDRANDAIRQVRPAFHDAVVEALD